MKLEELRKIAEQRTKGGRWGIVRTFHAPGFMQFGATTPLYPDKNYRDKAHKDGEFIALAANTYDALLEVAEAAKKFESATREYELEKSTRTACNLLETRGILVIAMKKMEEL